MPKTCDLNNVGSIIPNARTINAREQNKRENGSSFFFNQNQQRLASNV